MKKKYILMVISSLLLVLGACSAKKEVQPETSSKEVNSSGKIIYNLEIDKHMYQFSMLDGWRKFPNDDKQIAFLVGNKDTSSFMSAGFEEKKVSSLTEYKEDYMQKLGDTKAQVTISPEKRTLNGLEAYFLGVNMPADGDKELVYRIYLIETKDYYINLGAWTSKKNPDETILEGLTDILDTFKEVEK